MGASEKTAALSLCTLFVIGLVVAACGSRDGDIPNPYGLTTGLQGDPSIERTWIEPNVDRVTTISSAEKYTFYNPTSVDIYRNGFMYVTDAGDYKVKSFTQSGEYVATYGRGRGMGPGQVLTLTDGGIWRDSLVYIVDPRQRQVSFFEKDGSFVRVKQYDHAFYRLAWTRDSIQYTVPPDRRPGTLIKLRDVSNEVDIGLPIEGLEGILSAGYLHSIHGRAIYVPRFLPVLLTYSPTDTTGTAYPTPDYGRSLPEPEEEGAPSTEIHLPSALRKGVLSIQHPTPDVDSIAFDLYDASAMEYMHSVRLPSEGARSAYDYNAGMIATVRDTTVQIYHLQRPER